MIILSQSFAAVRRRLHCFPKQILRRYAVDQKRLGDGTLLISHGVLSDAPRLSPTTFISVGSTSLEQDGGAFLS